MERKYYSIKVDLGMEQRLPHPSSPGTSPVNLRDSIEELLKFTLESHINETLEFDLGFSKDFCSNLLRDDPDDSNPQSIDALEGVPPYPLYKRLALALHQSIISGAFCGMYNRIALLHEDDSLKLKEDEWNQLILDKGRELVTILETIAFELHVQQPFFLQLKDGLKTVEGRCAVGDYNRIGPGTSILFNRCVVLEVQDVHRYASFAEMLQAECLAEVLPGVKTVEEGVQIYRKFYTEEKERSNGVLAICVSRLAAQPYISLARILSGLSYDGVQSLLGLAHTTGTISDGLPPPRSTLLSSFIVPCNPNFEIKGNTLTSGARALAKHADRSSNKYWGSLAGNDSNKNRLAMDVISRLVACCCWLNVHIVPPHGIVFEIRDAEGYGARWSKDGTKFIGFLEPYMEDGHSKGWTH